MIKLSSIKANPNNPRVINSDKFKKLVKSIKDFPKMMDLRPMVVNSDNIVLGGNMRLKALKELGYKEVPKEWIKSADNLTKDEQRQFIIKDNIGFGEHDWEMLQAEWDLSELEDWGLDIPEWDNEEVLEAKEDDFDTTPPEEPKTVLGDLYEIGEHRLLCGDSTQTDTFEKLMQGEFADMTVTDPPYNVSYEGKTKDALTIENDSMGNDDFYKFLYDFYTACNSFIKKGGAWYVWHADLEGVNFRKAFKDAGIKLSSVLIWNKNTLVMGRGDFHWKHEPCLYGWREGEAHNWYSDRKQTTIIDFDKPSRNGEHPTMKPIGLFGYQIENSSKVNEIVIDAFGGSGTTMVACEQLKRKARIIEYDPKYCDVIVKRMIALDSNLKIKLNGKEIEHSYFD